jgi:hypothetical protein
MLIDIDAETIDKIFQNTLIQDYRMLLKQKQELTEKLTTVSLQQYELEDLNDTDRWLSGIGIMMEYYIGANWKDKV